MATIKDVARHAGVTPSVVSRLLSGDPTLRVRPETKARVAASVAELGYAPNRAARALRRARTGALGMAMRDPTSPVYGEIFRGAEEEAGRADHVFVVADLDSLTVDPATFRRLTGTGAIDGLVIQRDGQPGDDALLAGLRLAELPFVVVNERVEPPLAGVALDDTRAGRVATAHLIALGHTEIASIDIGGPTSRSADRHAGWDQAMRHAGLEPRSDLVAVGGARPETGYRAMTELLATVRRPSAVVVGTLVAAVGALTAIRHAGLRVPEDISVIAHHDAWFAEHVTPPLTVVRSPLRELGRRAVRLLLDRVDGQPARQDVVTEPPPELVHRGSTVHAPAGRR
ncbi:LacI family DNA-binding transcriptional regulator [Plantactinospora sp. GCM10030261]|uniref:LacI family DNA-binding transcriptional regulator n=1 Tax=Plantactinospora sp. GCM10030261 TaxID=3273420 RepID=UPI00361155D2